MDIPKELDWIQARVNCSIERVFLALHRMAVDGVQKLPTDWGAFDYEVLQQSKSLFVVVARQEGRHIKSIRFERTNGGLLVVTPADPRGPAAKPLFTAVPRFGEDGTCRLQLEGDGELLYLWQVSRLALEELLFEL